MAFLIGCDICSLSMPSSWIFSSNLMFILLYFIGYFFDLYCLILVDK